MKALTSVIEDLLKKKQSLKSAGPGAGGVSKEVLRLPDEQIGVRAPQPIKLKDVSKCMECSTHLGSGLVTKKQNCKACGIVSIHLISFFVDLFSVSLPHFYKCHKTSRIFMRTKQEEFWCHLLGSLWSKKWPFWLLEGAVYLS